MRSRSQRLTAAASGSLAVDRGRTLRVRHPHGEGAALPHGGRASMHRHPLTTARQLFDLRDPAPSASATSIERGRALPRLRARDPASREAPASTCSSSRPTPRSRSRSSATRSRPLRARARIIERAITRTSAVDASSSCSASSSVRVPRALEDRRRHQALGLAARIMSEGLVIMGWVAMWRRQRSSSATGGRSSRSAAGSIDYSPPISTSTSRRERYLRSRRRQGTGHPGILMPCSAITF